MSQTSQFPPAGKSDPNLPPWEELDDSPLTISGASQTVSTPNAHQVLIRSESPGVAHNSIQIEGDTGANYRYITQDGNRTLGDTRFPVPPAVQRYPRVVLNNDGGGIGISANAADSGLSALVGGRNFTVGGPITEFRLFDKNSVSRTHTYEVYHR